LTRCNNGEESNEADGEEEDGVAPNQTGGHKRAGTEAEVAEAAGATAAAELDGDGFVAMLYNVVSVSVSGPMTSATMDRHSFVLSDALPRLTGPAAG